jgi:hypothetical protein
MGKMRSFDALRLLRMTQGISWEAEPHFCFKNEGRGVKKRQETTKNDQKRHEIDKKRREIDKKRPKIVTKRRKKHKKG